MYCDVWKQNSDLLEESLGFIRALDRILQFYFCNSHGLETDYSTPVIVYICFTWETADAASEQEPNLKSKLSRSAKMIPYEMKTSFYWQ